ncbi:MAG: type II secretion system protein [candidate division Zixibacteria bacterium]|nr:type II secretion system protein [candidate division Zixibacteria bacterium]
MMKRKILSNRGVTLIELLITAVIVGIVATMAVPRFQIAYERHRYNGANRAVNSTFRLARSMAITDKEQYGLHFDVESRAYTIFKDKVNLSGFDFVSGDSIIRSDTLPPEFGYIVTDVENNVFLFRPNGSCRFNGGGSLVMLAYSEGVVAVFTNNVLASTGRIHSTSDFY